MDRILVIDAGTSALRAVSVARDGAVDIIGAEPWPEFTPDDAAPLGRELRPHAVASALNHLLDAAPSEVAAVAVTGQREGMALLDAGGECIFAAPNVDARAAGEGAAIEASHADAVHETTGHLPSLLLAPAKLRWLRANRPALADRVVTLLPLADWLGFLLTGECSMSRTLAAEIGVLDVRTGEPATDLLRSLEFDASLLPCLATAAGVSTARGRLAGKPVVLAGGDTQCALLGCGAARAGSAAVIAGWTAPVQMTTDTPVVDAQRRTWTGLHALPGRWVLESNAGETGRGWDWMCSLLGVTAAAGDALAAQAPRGANDVLAALGPRVMRAGAMNAGTGAMTVPLPLVLSAPRREDVLRATLEAAAYAVRSNTDQLAEVSGRRIDRLGMSGGMSRSGLFAQMVADVAGRTVERARTPHATALGAAALASVAAGWHATADEAGAALCGNRTPIEPDPRAAAEYDDAYERWRALCETLESNAL